MRCAKATFSWMKSACCWPARSSPSCGAAPPEARDCRDAFAGIIEMAAPLAAVSGNLERLYLAYRRALRRARALQDVLLPELDRTVYEMEAGLEDLEREDAIAMRWKTMG